MYVVRFGVKGTHLGVVMVEVDAVQVMVSNNRMLAAANRLGNQRVKLRNSAFTQTPSSLWTAPHHFSFTFKICSTASIMLCTWAINTTSLTGFTAHVAQLLSSLIRLTRACFGPLISGGTRTVFCSRTSARASSTAEATTGLPIAMYS